MRARGAVLPCARGRLLPCSSPFKSAYEAREGARRRGEAIEKDIRQIEAQRAHIAALFTRREFRSCCHFSFTHIQAHTAKRRATILLFLLIDKDDYYTGIYNVLFICL